MYKRQALFILWLLALALFLVAAFAFISLRGVERHGDGKHWRLYLSYLGKRAGAWQELDQLQEIVLLRDRVDASVRLGFVTPQSYNNAQPTYELVAKLRNNMELPLCELSDYKKARKHLHAIGSTLNVEVRDHWAEHRQRQRSKKRR